MPSPSPERQAQLSARARLFDADALLQALAELGYRDEDILFQSRHGILRPASLVEAVEFERDPPRAVVTINLGLLGADSPLPSYMRRQIEGSTDRLVPFFRFFDHTLLRSRLRSLWPERDAELGCDWAATRRHMSKLVRLDSPAMAHWLFRHVYPELEVAVRRAPQKRTVPTAPVVLGKTSIGDGAALGGVTEVLCGGLAATLVATEPSSPRGVPWQEESARRLQEHLLPNIVDAEMGLTVTLVIRDRPNQLTLSPSSFLGLQPLESSSSSTKVLIFDGPIQKTGARAQLLGQPTEAPAASRAAPPPPQRLVEASQSARHGQLPPSPSASEVRARAEAHDEYLCRLA